MLRRLALCSQGCSDLTDDASSAIRTTLSLTRWFPPEPLGLAPGDSNPYGSFSVVANGSSCTAAPVQKLMSQSQHICSKSLVYKPSASFPSNTPFRSPRIRPIRKSSPPPETAPPGRLTCSKRPVYKAPGSLPQPRPFLASGSCPSLSLASPGTAPPGPPPLLQGP